MRTLVLTALLATPLAAAPAWHAELTGQAPGKHPRITPASFTFDLSWRGMLKAGEIRMDFSPPDSRRPGTYVVRSSASGKGAASALVSSRYQFLSEMNAGDLRPRVFTGTETSSSETATTTVRYTPGGTESRETTRHLRSGKTTTTDKRFAHHPVHDLFSAMLHIRSQPLKPGDRVVTVVQPSDTPYLVRVRCVARELHQGRPALRLTVGMQKIDRDSMQLRPYKKLKRDATLWLSDDRERVPLELRAAVFIGDVRAVLSGYRPH